MPDEMVSVIIPAYNEESVICRLVEDTLKVMNQYGKQYEVLVIDDGSTDGTFEAVQRLRNKNLRVIKNTQNIGKTKTILKGSTSAKGSIISFIDADYQYDPHDLPKVIEKVKQGADLCVGYRERRQDTRYRKLMSWGFNQFDRVLFGIKIRDVNCGLKAYRAESFKKMNLRFLSAKWFIDTEILTRYYHRKYKVEEVPIAHYERGDGRSKVSCIKLMVETLIFGILLKWELMFGRK